MIDKWEALNRIEEALKDPIEGEKVLEFELFHYFRMVWNTDDERTFEEWKQGVEPHGFDEVHFEVGGEG